MAGASCIALLEFPDLLARLEASQDRIERVIAATVQTQVGLRFDAEGAHNGHDKWAPLKSRKGQILSLTGTLRRSIAPNGARGRPGSQGFVRSSGPASDLLVEVGTTVKYASIHNNGAVFRRTGETRVFKVYTAGEREGQHRFASRREIAKDAAGKTPKNQKIMRRDVKDHEVRIPRRNFTDLNPTDEQEVADALAELVADILGAP